MSLSLVPDSRLLTQNSAPAAMVRHRFGSPMRPYYRVAQRTSLTGPAVRTWII